MVLTPSTMMPLGTKAPDFSLPDTISGDTVSLEDIQSSIGTVVLFICNHCPYVIHLREKLVELAKTYQALGINFVAISSNDAEHYPADAPDKMHDEALEHGFTFPYLYDESQEVARAYNAACTPDIFVFDHDMQCVYRGQFDDSRPGNDKPVTGADLANALDHLLSGEENTAEQVPSMGCNIKWKDNV